MFLSAQKLISQSIDKCNRLLELADSKEWEAFIELEAQRQAELQTMQLDALDLTESQYGEIQNQMKILIDLNMQLEQVCRQQRSDLADQMKDLNKGHKAKKAYSQ